MNGDGKPDLVVANWCESPTQGTTSNVGVLLNKGDGTFWPAVTYDAGGYHAFAISVGDVNGDRKPDLILAIGCADVGAPLPQGVLLGNGDGTFQSVHNYPSGGWIHRLFRHGSRYERRSLP